MTMQEKIKKIATESGIDGLNISEKITSDGRLVRIVFDISGKAQMTIAILPETGMIRGLPAWGDDIEAIIKLDLLQTRLRGEVEFDKM